MNAVRHFAIHRLSNKTSDAVSRDLGLQGTNFHFFCGRSLMSREPKRKRSPLHVVSVPVYMGMGRT